MKRNRRILSLLLAICLVVALAPAVFAAEDAALAESASDDQTVSFAGKEWIVIDNNSGDHSIVLLLKNPEKSIPYNASGLSNAWDGSSAAAWCAAFKAELDATALSAVLDNNGEKVFFLTEADAITYFANNSRDTLVAKDADSNAVGWWLGQSKRDDGNLFGVAISDAGFFGTPHVAANYYARPAIEVDTTKIAAMIDSDDDGVLELKVVDETNSSFSVVGDPVVAKSGEITTVTVKYGDADTGSTVHALVIDQLGQTVAYGSAPAADTDTELSVELPNIVGRYTVRVFNEVNGLARNVTDREITITDDLGNVVAWRLSLGDDICAEFQIELDSNLDPAMTDICFAISGGEAEKRRASELGLVSEDNPSIVILPVPMIAPQMADTITIHVETTDGKVGGTQDFSIRQYGEAIINGNFSSAAKNLAKHMLNYGAEAQTYFNYNTDDLANVNIGALELESVPAPGENDKATLEGEVAGIKAYGTNLVLNSKTTLRFYFSLTGDNYTIDDFYFAGLTAYKRDSNNMVLYFVDIDGIAPNELDKEHTVTVKSNAGTETLTVTYSPMFYIRKFANNGNKKSEPLMTAMYNYYLAAVAYVSDTASAE